MTAGKWIAQDRGSKETTCDIPEPKPVPLKFPLADRIDPISLVLLYSFREGLRNFA